MTGYAEVRGRVLGPRRIHAASVVVVMTMLASGWSSAQTSGEREEFIAVAVVNNTLGSGAGTVLMQVTRWSTEGERRQLVETLLKEGPAALLDALRDNRPTGTIRTPDSLGYDLRFAQQTAREDGGRRVVLATDRPIGFWEASRQARTLDYPFTVIQMEFDRHGRGTGTLSLATKILTRGNTIELENFASSPVMLTEVTVRTRDAR